jgi:D-lactate dehydrogenase
MKAVAYSSKICEKQLLIKANNKKHEITLISNRLTFDTIAYAKGKDAVLVCPSDDVSAPILNKLKELGVKYIATRSTGTDHIDLEEASRLGLKVGNIPTYSPESVAEHTVAMILALLRNILPAHDEMENYNFSLNALVGNTIRNKTIGIIGLGRTGKALAKILTAFGARMLVNDIDDVQAECVKYDATQVSFDKILREADIISFHVPLNETTRHMVNADTISKMKDGVILINVSRGAVFNTNEVFTALEDEKISKLGMDVYEFEQDVFFFNHSKDPVQDPLLKALIQHPRVLLTPHMAFLTEEALQVIAERTISNLDLWEADKCVGNACCCLKECVDTPKALSA